MELDKGKPLFQSNFHKTPVFLMEKFIYFFNMWNPKVNVRMGWDYSSGIGPQQQPNLIFESTRPNSCSSNGTLGGSQIDKFGFSWPIRIGLKLEPRHNNTCSPISSMRTLQWEIILSSGLTWKRMNPSIKKIKHVWKSPRKLEDHFAAGALF